MSKVKEMFGMYCNGQVDLTDVLSEQICPYSHKKGLKPLIELSEREQEFYARKAKEFCPEIVNARKEDYAK